MLLDQIYYQFSTFNYFIMEKISIVEIISILPNVVISVCAVITVCYVRNGLSSWKNHFNAKTEYDLARRILISVYKYREAIDIIRTPKIRFTLATNQDIINFYVENYKTVIEFRRELLSNAFESIVHWNFELKPIIDKLVVVEKGIEIMLVPYLSVLSIKNKPDNDNKIETKIEIELQAKPGSNDDEISKKINPLFKDIEGFLKPKLVL